ncbi:hypothetical protein SME46J_47490 [Serratia marcescens]|nr:hypothetical protein SME46J_47490 [Serratia marcescens]
MNNDYYDGFISSTSRLTLFVAINAFIVTQL